MRQLLWKEWHEQAWKLAFGSVVLATLCAIGLRSRMVADATMIEWACAIGVLVLPVLSATGLVPAERGEGSFESLVSLPVTPRDILLAKTVAGVGLCVGPMVVATAVSLAIAGGREMYASAMVAFYARATLASVALLVWMVALTVRLPTEARAALLAMGVLVLWALATAGLGIPLASPNLGVPHAVSAAGFAISPFAFLFPLNGQLPNAPPLWATVPVQAVVSTLAWLLGLRMFARSTEDAT